MSLTGKVQNGVVVLPDNIHLTEGTEVGIIPLESLPGDPLFLQGILKLAKPRDWPADFALNHVYHVREHVNEPAGE